jgi:hypothetical protein
MSLTAELLRQVAKSQKVEGFKQPPEVWTSVVNRYLCLPALRGFWPMSSMDYTAASRCIDLSGQGNHLTENGTANQPSWNYAGLIPYTDFDPTDNQHFSRADGGVANWADVTGLEAQVAGAAQGLTVGGWFWLDDATANRELIAKWTGVGNQRAYRILYTQATNTFNFILSSNGALTTNVASSVTPSTGRWFYVVGTLIPGTEQSIYVNGVRDDFGSGIASINDSTSQFEIGAVNTGTTNFLDGRASMAFLCAAQLSDTIILSLFEQTRAMFGV